MNQFNKYKNEISKKSNIWTVINDFDYILNSIWSVYSFEKGKSKWLSIQSEIDPDYSRKINIEIGHVEIGHGKEQALMSVKDEMEKYIEYLIYGYTPNTRSKVASYAEILHL